jgi:fructose-1,6-bisphosphatase/sedoheptulose 1,7-bisphosphatase-like protein
VDHRTPTLDDALELVTQLDRRPRERVLGDALQQLGHLVRPRMPGDALAQRAACLVRDALALLALAGGSPADVAAAARLLDLYRSADDVEPPLGERVRLATGAELDADRRARAAADVVVEHTPVTHPRVLHAGGSTWTQY